jgi:spore germination protein KC
MRKWLLLLLLLFLSLFTIEGCGYKDIEKRFFVVSIGFDKPSNSNNLYKMTLKLAIPKSDPKNKSDQFILLSEEAKSISEATRLFKAETDKELDFTHAKLIILGEQLLEESIEPIIDWSIRRRDIQGVAWVAIGKPSANAVLASESEFTVSTFLFDFFRKSYEKGFQAILPMIEVKENTFTIKKAAIFDKFVKKLILSPNETKLLNLLMTGFNKGSL